MLQKRNMKRNMKSCKRLKILIFFLYMYAYIYVFSIYKELLDYRIISIYQI